MSILDNVYIATVGRYFYFRAFTLFVLRKYLISVTSILSNDWKLNVWIVPNLIMYDKHFEGTFLRYRFFLENFFHSNFSKKFQSIVKWGHHFWSNYFNQTYGWRKCSQKRVRSHLLEHELGFVHHWHWIFLKMLILFERKLFRKKSKIQRKLEIFFNHIECAIFAVKVGEFCRRNCKADNYYISNVITDGSYPSIPSTPRMGVRYERHFFRSTFALWSS